LPRHFPQPGRVEHDPIDTRDRQFACARHVSHPRERHGAAVRADSGAARNAMLMQFQADLRDTAGTLLARRNGHAPANSRNDGEVAASVAGRLAP
jgi:glycerol kinase